MNIWIGTGRLARNPEITLQSDGKRRVTFTMAIDNDFKNKTTGEKDTVWFDVTNWSKSDYANIVHLGKGDLVSVVGRVDKPSAYLDKDGCPRAVNKVIASSYKLLAHRVSDKDKAAQDAVAAQQQQEALGQDDDLPF